MKGPVGCPLAVRLHGCAGVGERHDAVKRQARLGDSDLGEILSAQALDRIPADPSKPESVVAGGILLHDSLPICRRPFNCTDASDGLSAPRAADESTLEEERRR